MNRPRLLDLRTSRLPAAIGLCMNDQPRIAQMVNSAQQQLLFGHEQSDEGPYGTWAEMVFNVSQASPFITTPREVARIQKMTVCKRPVNIQNQFYEYLQFGCGPKPPLCATDNQGSAWLSTAYSRNNVPLFTDLTTPPQYIRIYSADTTGADLNKRVLVQGTDASGNRLYSLDNGYRVDGVFVTLANPFADVQVAGVNQAYGSITGIQKDVTLAPIQIKQVDLTTGAEVLLSQMEPSETVANYRRYYLYPLPASCCQAGSTTIQVDSIVKLELVPVVADPDYLLIQNVEALIHQCQSIRYQGMDTSQAKQFADWHHAQAIRLLNGQTVHYLGKEKPAVGFHPFGSFSPSGAGIGMI